MLKSIVVNTKALESMLFIWATLKDREKVVETFLIDLASSPEMQASFSDEFDAMSVQKVLSAISNHELMNKPTKAESRFWNYNMWMLEDMDFCQMMVQPLKTLNLDHLLKSAPESFPFEDLEVIFYPGQLETATWLGNKLYLNFFKVKADVNGIEENKFEDLPIDTYILQAMKEL